jgi:hypothetical protein
VDLGQAFDAPRRVRGRGLIRQQDRNVTTVCASGAVKLEGATHPDRSDNP